MIVQLLFYPRKDKKNQKTGKIPMYLRITLNRKKAELRLSADINEEELLKWDEQSMRFNDRNMGINSFLTNIEKNFNDFKYHNATNLSEFNVKMIRNLVMGMDKTPAPLVIKYVDGYYEKAIAPNQQMADGTKRNYRKAFKHLKDFLACRKTQDASLKEFTNSVAFEFKDYLLGTHSSFNRIGMKEPPGLHNIKLLRTYLIVQ